MAVLSERSQDIEHLAGVLQRVERQAVRHQITAIRGLTVVGVVAHAHAGAAQVGQDGRRPGEELEIHGRVDSQPAHPHHGSQGVQHNGHHAVGPDRDHVFFGDDVQQVEDEAVLGKD